MRGDWSGEGPRVVLLHGQPGSAADWELVVPHLAGHRLLVPTRPGYDGRPARGFAGNAAELAALLRRTRSGPCVVVGHSWGGGVALQLALDAPELVSGLCLLGSVGSPLALTRTDRVMAAWAVRDVAAAFMTVAGRRAAPLVERSSGSRLDPHGRVALRAALSLWSATGGWSTYAQEQVHFVQDAPGLAARLGAVQAPTVVAVGRRDATVPPQTGRDLAARLLDAVVRVLDAGHLMPLEAPEQVALVVQEAVRRAEPVEKRSRSVRRARGR